MPPPRGVGLSVSKCQTDQCTSDVFLHSRSAGGHPLLDFNVALVSHISSALCSVNASEAGAAALVGAGAVGDPDCMQT